MQGLMMDMPLLISGLIQYAADYHGEAEIVAREIEGDIHRYTYADAHPRIKRMILVPMDTPGIEVKRPLPVFGFYGVPDRASEVVFTNVRVPKENMQATGPLLDALERLEGYRKFIRADILEQA